MNNKNILLIFIFFLILFLILDNFYSKKNNSSCLITFSERVYNSHKNNKFILNLSGKTKQNYNSNLSYKKKGIIEYERHENAINEFTDRYRNIVERRKIFEHHVHDVLTKEWGAIEVEFPENKIIILKHLKILELIDLVDQSEENLLQLHRQWWQRNYKFIPEERKIIFPLIP